MKKLLLVSLITLCYTYNKGQNLYYSYLTEKLHTMKEEAVRNSDYDKAAYLKKELDKREAEKNKIMELQAQLEASVQSENFDEAAVTKEELKELKENVFLKDSLRNEIAKALSAEDYNTVASLKQELKLLEDASLNATKPLASSEPENTTTPAPELPQGPQPKKYNYIEKVREVQKSDPGCTFYFGNGWLMGRALLNPIVGLEFRFSRKNVFVRGFSIGIRACFQNALGDGDRITGSSGDGSTNLKEDGPITFDTYDSAGGMITLKYYAPIPLRKIQPYITSMAGLGAFNTSIGTHYWDPVAEKSVTSYAVSESTKWKVMIGSGVGCNFLLGKRFGAFIEGGFFRMSFINTGLVIKL